MHIHKIAVRNFRLLAKVELLLEERTTVIVGRNNSGKTSLTELFRRMLSNITPSFHLEDFSLSAHDDFWKAFCLKRDGKEEQEVRDALPVIEVELTMAYDKDTTSLGVLSDFIIDLDPECTEAHILFRYQLKDGGIGAFFDALDIDQGAAEDKQKREFFRATKERVPDYYQGSVLAVDPGDPENQKRVEFSTLRKLIQSGFINAQRGLDDTTNKEINLLGKFIESLWNSAVAESAGRKDHEIAKKLEASIRGIQAGIDNGFNEQLENLLPAFDVFGYPGLGDPSLRTETTLDVERLLKNNTKVHYAGANGMNLPETYNGLGVRNLVFILLKLYEFFKSFQVEAGGANTHLVFIEEPEVHLHPQMQEVFIGRLGAIAEVFSARFNDGKPWPVQFIVTTHSSHVANKASFDSIRYFLAKPDTPGGPFRFTQVKDLRKGFGESTLQEDRTFLHKYMTLTRCDLLFADKAILIEGTTERLLLPSMIEKMDAEDTQSRKLASQYVSVVEVGGAYAHRFFSLLQFLELRTLIITDLDTVGDNGKKCKVSEGIRTSNGCIKEWFGAPDITPAELIQKSDTDKARDIRRLAYEIPEVNGAPCGRSFEDAFMLANPDLFSLTGETSAERCRGAGQNQPAGGRLKPAKVRVM